MATLNDLINKVTLLTDTNRALVDEVVLSRTQLQQALALLGNYYTKAEIDALLEGLEWSGADPGEDPGPDPIPGDKPVWAALPPQTLTVGEAFQLRLANYVSGATSYTVQSGTLPAGVLLNTASGLFSGTPSTPMSSTLVFRASNEHGYADSGLLSITIKERESAPDAFEVISTLSVTKEHTEEDFSLNVVLPEGRPGDLWVVYLVASIVPSSSVARWEAEGWITGESLSTPTSTRTNILVRPWQPGIEEESFYLTGGPKTGKSGAVACTLRGVALDDPIIHYGIAESVEAAGTFPPVNLPLNDCILLTGFARSRLDPVTYEGGLESIAEIELGSGNSSTRIALSFLHVGEAGEYGPNLQWNSTGSRRTQVISLGLRLQTSKEADVDGRVFYVDYADGLDTNDGLTPMTPWKHYPGDPDVDEKGLVISSASLEPGDKVIFKGGVRYRGLITGSGGGTTRARVSILKGGMKGRPVIFDGNTAGTFGDGRAIIDAGEPITGWVADGVTTEGLPVYKASLPAPTEGYNPVIHDREGYCIPAQFPPPSSFYQRDNLDEFLSVEAEGVTETSITDPVNLVGISGDWGEARLLVWHSDNRIGERAIRSYDPVLGKITFDEIEPYQGRATRYAIINHERGFSYRGAYLLDYANRTIRLIPYAGFDPAAADVSVADCNTGININANFVTVRGFKIQNYLGKEGEVGYGNGIRSYIASNDENLWREGLLIKNNEICQGYSEEGYGALQLQRAKNSVIEDNYVHDHYKGRGIFSSSGRGITTRNNRVKRIGGSGLAYFGSKEGTVTDNEITEVNTVHANGLTFYLESDGCKVLRNKVSGGNNALTIKHTSDLLVAFNALSSPHAQTVAIWSHDEIPSLRLKFYNNTILTGGDSGFAIPEQSRSTTEVINNIIDRMSGGPDTFLRRENNVYTLKSWNQKPNYGWELNETEFDANRDHILADPNGFDIRPTTPHGVSILENGAPLTIEGTEVDYIGAIPMNEAVYREPPPEAGKWDSVLFDGVSDQVARDSPLDGATSSSKITIAMRFIAKPGRDGTARRLFATADNRVHFEIRTSDRYRITLRDSNNTVLGQFDGPSSPVITSDTGEIELLFSVDFVSLVQYRYLNGIRTVGTPALTEGEVDLTVGNFTFGNIGESTAFPVEVKYFYLTNEFIDFSIEENRDLFTADNIGENGEGPTGTPPLIYLTGAAAEWNDPTGINRGTGGPFLMQGGVTDVGI